MGEITYPFPNVNGATVEVWEWIFPTLYWTSNYLSLLVLKLIYVSKRFPRHSRNTIKCRAVPWYFTQHVYNWALCTSFILWKLFHEQCFDVFISLIVLWVIILCPITSSQTMWRRVNGYFSWIFGTVYTIIFHFLTSPKQTYIYGAGIP